MLGQGNQRGNGLGWVNGGHCDGCRCGKVIMFAESGDIRLMFGLMMFRVELKWAHQLKRSGTIDIWCYCCLLL